MVCILILFNVFLITLLIYIFRDSLTKQAIWKYNEISHTTENSGLGSIKAKFDISNGPSSPSAVNVQFSCQDTILSGLDFELIGSGYRLSMIKRQFSTGKLLKFNLNFLNLQFFLKVAIIVNRKHRRIVIFHHHHHHQQHYQNHHYHLQQPPQRHPKLYNCFFLYITFE